MDVFHEFVNRGVRAQRAIDDLLSRICVCGHSKEQHDTTVQEAEGSTLCAGLCLFKFTPGSPCFCSEYEPITPGKRADS